MEKVHEIKNVLVDSDVFMDYFLDRKPFSYSSSDFINIGRSHKIKMNVTPLTFANIYYLLRKASTHLKVIRALKDLSRVVNIIKLNERAVLNALDSDWKDFEDALQYFSSVQYKSLEAIVTRNKKDYKGSELPVLSPKEMVKYLSLNEG